MNNIIITEPSKNIRAMAREALAGKWKIAAVATLVYLVALMLPASILNIIFGGEDGTSLLSTLYTVLVTGAFTIGYSMFCINLFRNKDIEVAQVFYGFEKFGKALGLYFMMCLFIILWLLLLVIPGIIAAYRYSQAFYVMVDHPEYGIMQCLDESKRMMRGNKFKYFCLELSFIGWAILAIIPVTALTTALTLSEAPILLVEVLTYIGMVGYIWLTPYMNVSCIGFYEMANGNLRPGIFEANATIIEDGTITAETFVEENVENKTE
jgi:uncharacterized membrane protein